ncbi:MAG TPA: TlpA disulfide reductase family protein [Dongiaceae bacterium]|jgi:thiol-disulfide isomerase/thioredoxin|nr:TlpA disulfide reductase family protein [Dongiaceae bacterium]
MVLRFIFPLLLLTASLAWGADFTLLPAATPVPAVAFQDALGASQSLNEVKGPLVLNLWATWCPPCVAEMPSLDRLHARLATHGVQVIALSVDQAGIKAAAPFYRAQGITHLALYCDERASVMRALEVRNLPSTFLIDAKGRIVARLEGARNWDNRALEEEILRLVGSAS